MRKAENGDVRPAFDLSLSLVLESPSLDLREEENHSVEPATIRGKGRIDARINEMIRKIFRREETQSAQRGPGKSVTAEPRKTLQFLGPLESCDCVPWCALRLKELVNKPDRS